MMGTGRLIWLCRRCCDDSHLAAEGFGRAGPVRAAAAGSGTLTRVEGGIAFHVYEFARQARFLAKPVAWDETLWQVAGWRNPVKRSVSFRFRGVSVRVPALASRALHRDAVDDLAAQMVAFAGRAFGDFDPGFDVSFSHLMRHDMSPNSPSDFVITEMIWHLSEGRRCEARTFAGRRRSSFNMATGEGNVFELVQGAVLNGEI